MTGEVVFACRRGDFSSPFASDSENSFSTIFLWAAVNDSHASMRAARSSRRLNLHPRQIQKHPSRWGSERGRPRPGFCAKGGWIVTVVIGPKPSVGTDGLCTICHYKIRTSTPKIKILYSPAPARPRQVTLMRNPSSALRRRKAEAEFRDKRNPSSVIDPRIYKEEELEEGADVSKISGGGVFYQEFFRTPPPP